MAVRDWVSRTFGAKASIIGLAADELPDRALEKSFDDGSLLSTYADDAWPYIVANKVGEQASQAPVQIGRVRVRNNAEEFAPVGPDHPVQLLFDRPNVSMEGGEFIHLLLVYMGITGHAPIEFVGPGPGARIGAPGRAGSRRRDGYELWLHNPTHWRIVANPDGSVRGYLWVRTSEEDIRWTPEQMTYLRWPNPSNRWYGQGHIQAVRQQVMAEEYAAVRDKTFEKQLGVPPGILSSEMPLGDPQARELQKRWEQAVGGYRNAGRVAVLGSKTSYQAVAVNSRDAEWLAQRRDRVEIIAAAWGVPLPLIRMQDAKFANAQEARAEFWEGTLQPRLNRIARMLTQRLLPLVTTEPLVARFDYSGIEALGENDLEAAQTAKAWSDTGTVTVDEVRARLGLTAHPDATVGRRLIVPGSLSLKDPDEVGEMPEPLARPLPPEEPRQRSATKAAGEDREIVLAPIIDAYRRDLGSFFEAQLAALTPLTPKAIPADDGLSLIDRAIEILTAKRWRDRLDRISEPPIRAAITIGASTAASGLGVAVSFAIPASEEALALLTGHLERLGVGIQNATVADVRRVLTETLSEGLSNAQTRERLRELFADYQDWRLDRISRTETRAAYNLGALGQYGRAGVTMVTVTDGDLDDICAPWNGRYTTLEDAQANPLGHPNCRRDFIPDTSGLGRSRSDDDVLRFEVKATVPPITPIVVQAPAPYMEAPVINIPETVVNVAAPVVNVAPTDLRPLRADMAGLRTDMADLRAEIRKPRTKRLVRDQLGNIVGSEDVVE